VKQQQPFIHVSVIALQRQANVYTKRIERRWSLRIEFPAKSSITWLWMENATIFSQTFPGISPLCLREWGSVGQLTVDKPLIKETGIKEPPKWSH
jgi:hypothetical protein